jgi:abequosyltransferase
MPPERPLLTIAIPTYNRSATLELLLEGLAPQLNSEARVELIISDNASADDTPKVVASWQQRGLRCNYRRNENNIGPDANFIQCYEMAGGEYVWIFGDDDIILPGALEEVLRCLESRKWDLVHLTTAEFRGTRVPAPGERFSGKTLEFDGPGDFALRVSTGFTFISGIIVSKAAIESQPHRDFRELIGTNLAQLAWVFTLLRDKPRCVCLLDRLVASRVENSGGYGACQVFGTNLHRIVDQFLGHENPAGRAILNRTLQSWFPWALVQDYRGHHGSHLPEDAMRILQGLYRDNPRYWVFVHPLFRLPLPLAELWLLAVRAVNRLDRSLGYPIAR